MLLALRDMKANTASRQSAIPVPFVGTMISRLRNYEVSNKLMGRACESHCTNAAGMSGESLNP